MIRFAALVVVAAAGTVGALSCTDDPKGAPGDKCVLHTDCRSGVCALAQCLTVGGDDDGDGAPNADELTAGSNPLNPDTDGDGTWDGEELGGDPSNPTDDDGDGNPNFRESSVLDRDLDGEPDQDDGSDDIPELDAGVSCANHGDCGDGICVGRQCYAGDDDLDQDEISNGDERRIGTNPLNPDTDADGDRDGAEVRDAENPTDSDGDAKIDARESSKVDSDGDGVTDQDDPS